MALLLFLGGVGYLAYSGFSENSVYFLNVSEALATPSDKLKAARLFGTVAEDGLSRSETGRDVKFRAGGSGKQGHHAVGRVHGRPFRIPSRPVRKSLWKGGSGLTVRFRPKRS